MNNEIIVVNKPIDYTSRDVVNKLIRIKGTRKIGHTGTLDPLATGVLVCVTNKYTKLVEIITGLEKEYIASIKLGISTDTLDITGEVIKASNTEYYDEDYIKKILNSFVGEYSSEVPLYSAVRVKGKRLYEYARNNIEVDAPIRNVYIKEIELIDYKDDIITFRVVVSKGTYIRSLIQSICDKLNTCGTMSSLVRTKQGNFKIEDSYSLEDIEKGNYKSLSIKDVLDVSVVELNDALFKKVINGNKLEIQYSGYVLFVKDNEEIALYEFLNNIGKLKIMLCS